MENNQDSGYILGIVTLLVNGLSGSTPQQIERVRPEFIQFAGIGASLTPGRNNGFLNMLRVMKDQARSFSTSSSGSTSEGPIYRSVVTKLGLLKPVELVVEDESHKHAGHAGMKGVTATETHFKVKIIAECFSALSLVQRHKVTSRSILLILP
jgi:stress-induced morphogen